MCSGLKRSMPCEDLISLKDAGFSNLQAEANRFLDESSRMLLQSSSKRQRLELKSVPDKNPATAALEAALLMDDAIGFDSSFDSDLVQISLLSTPSWAPDAILFSHDYYPCTKHLHKGAIPSVHSVENVAGILSKLTTTPSAA